MAESDEKEGGITLTTQSLNP